MGNGLCATRRRTAVAAHLRADLVRGARRARRTRPDAHHPLPRGRGAVGARAGAPGARRRAPQPNGRSTSSAGRCGPVSSTSSNPRSQRRARAEAGGVLRRQPSRPPAWSRPSDSAATGRRAPFLLGPPATIVLERLGGTAGVASHRFDGTPHPTLEIATSVALRAGRAVATSGSASASADGERGRRTRRDLRAIPPRARGPAAAGVRPACARGGARDAVARRAADGRARRRRRDRRAHARSGFDVRLRDGLQRRSARSAAARAARSSTSIRHAALSVLRNTCAWATPERRSARTRSTPRSSPTNLAFRPSDQNLWALWLAAEYAAATGDLAAFDEPLAVSSLAGDGGRAAARAPAPAVPLLRRSSSAAASAATCAS